MAQKKMYYFKVSLYDSSSNLLELRELRRLYRETFNNHATNDHLVVVEKSLDDHQITMDILKFEQDILFFRICKEKENNAFIERDDNNLSANDLPIGEDKTIEMYTYMCIDFSTGILFMVKNQSAPNEQIVNRILSNYNSPYRTEITAIPNSKSLEGLFRDNSVISSTTIEIPVPNIQVLEDILGFDRRLSAAYANSETKMITLTMRGEPWKSIGFGGDVNRAIVNALQGLKGENKITGGRIRGRAGQTLTQDYDLFNEIYGYPLTINTYTIDNQQRKYLSIEELKDEFENQMMAAYNHEKDNLILQAGI